MPATTPVTRARITRLVSETDYIFFVEARDAAGNVSGRRSTSPITRTTVPGIERHVRHDQHLARRRLPGRVPDHEQRIGAARQLAHPVHVHGHVPVGLERRAAARRSAATTFIDPGSGPQHPAGPGRDGRRRQRPERFGNPATPPGGFEVAAGRLPGPRPRQASAAVPRRHVPERDAVRRSCRTASQAAYRIES